MKTVWLIIRRELATYFRSYMGFIIIALYLLIDALFFNAFAMGSGGQKKSAEVLHDYLLFSGGLNGFASVFVSMRLFAEERQTGTLPLLLSAPVTDAQIVLGKFFSGFLFLAITNALTLYMPVLIYVKGSIAISQIVAGYLGLLILGAMCIAVGVFGSVLAPSQIVAGIISGVVLGALWVAWMLAFVTERPLNDVFSYLAVWHKHYQPFMDGIVNVRDIIYYLSVSYVFLHLSTRVLQARRWR